MRIHRALLATSGILLWPLHSPAATFHVNANGSNPVFPYSNWSTAATNIQNAVDAADSGDLILVTNGVYQFGGRIVYGSLTNRLVIGKPILVQSVNGPAVTTIEGNPFIGDSAVRCVYLTNGATLSGFSLINGATRVDGDGYQEQCGGAAWCESTNSFITNCILTSNSAALFGGAAFRGSLNNCSVIGNIAYGAGGGGFSSLLNNCAVSYNQAMTAANNPSGSTSGGGLEGCVASNCAIAGNVTHSDNYGDDAGGGANNSQLYNCVISNNWAHGEGGGAANSTLQSCTLLQNRADGNGGGGASGSALLNCLVVSNSAYWGAGLNNGSATNCVLRQNTSDAQGGGTSGSSLFNCLLIGNSGSTGGGASANPSGTGATLVNCTVYGNSASFRGGGIDSSIAENSIIVSNWSTNQPASSNWYGGTLSNCCTIPLPGVGMGNITNDPLFLSPVGSDFHLQSNSPCINIGNNAYVTSILDLDGNLRLLNGTVDLGPYEFHLVSSPIISIQANYTNVVVGYPVNFFGASTGGRSDSWNFGDGMVTSNQWSVTHAWSSVGDYAVTLTLFDSNYPGGVSTNFIVHVVPPPVLYVNANGANPVAPYTSWGTAATNIQDAIDVASPGYHILVTNGVYQVGGKVTSDGTTNRVAVTNSVTVQSVNGPAVTLINGGNVMRCVYLTNGAALSGFTLTNGVAGTGGGLYCTGTNAITSNCTLVNNTATSGGGAYSGTLTNCTLAGNTCPLTGGNGGGATGSTLVNCTLTGNVTGRQYPNSTGASWGGGASGGLLFNCTLSGNSSYGAGSHGAGASGATLNNCTLVNNYTDDQGGGAYNSTLNSCLLTGNYGIVGGGATEGTLNNCTIVGNRSAGNGGGGTYYLTANNCIIVNNTAPNNLSSSLNYCCTPDGGLGCFTNAPLFVNEFGGDYHLQTYSPCINAGSNAYVATTVDLDGKPRIVGATVDCGAYENQSATADAGLPTIPTALTAVRSGTNALLNWPTATRATGYAVYRATASGGAFTKIAPSVLSTNYTDSTTVSGGTYFYFVTAVNSYGESSGSPVAIVYFVDHFAFAVIPSPQTSGVPFTVTMNACDNSGNTLSNFNGGAALGAAGDHGYVPISPAIATAFANGQWVGSVTLDSGYPDANIRLTAISNSVSGTSNPFKAVAPAIQVFTGLLVADLAYNPFAQRLYAVAPAAATVLSNSLIVIDPVMGRIETNYFLGNDPNRLAVSCDGQFIYVGFNGTNAFGRFNLASKRMDFIASLGMDNHYGLAYHASQFAVLPGKPRSVAVAVNTGFGDASQVLIFDDGIERSNTFGGLASYSGTVVAAAPTRLYAGAPFTRIDVDQTGVAAFDSPGGFMGLSDLIKYQAGLVFTPGGNVFNPETLSVIGTLTNCSIVEPDLPAGRIYSMGSHPVFAQPDAWRLYAWNATNLQLLGSLDMPTVYGGPSTLVRWGTNGIAFGSPGSYISQFFIVRTPLVSTVVPALKGGSQSASGPFQLVFTGDQSIPYTVWSSTNLTSWASRGPASLMSNGWFWYWDDNATNFPCRFYRVGVSQ